jgi:DNA-binding GntR family transcriptional regulator
MAVPALIWSTNDQKGGHMDLKLGGLERRTTPEGIYRMLRAAILEGRVPPGGQLRERDIAADLGVSRSPLREALTKLEEEGLVVKFPFRGAFVVEVSAHEVAEIASVRLLVEPYAGELALDALRGPERPRFTRTIEDLRRAAADDDVPASIDAHLQFHSLFYDLSGHGVLRSLWHGWETKLRLYFSVDHRSYSDLHAIADEHERLAEVALQGGTDAFRRALADHFPSALAGTREPGNPPPPGMHEHRGAGF